MTIGKIHKSWILYEDNHLIAVNKPASVLSQSDQTKDVDIISMTKAYVKEAYDKPGEVYMGLPHRLDRPVSGVLLLCKTSKGLTRMSDIFKKREIKKTYHAIIQVVPSDLSGTLTSYVKKSGKMNRSNISDKSFKGAKLAVLHYKLIGQIKDYSLLEIELETGRSHQIRVQLSQHKMPILGDLKYKPQRPLIDKSIALHAHSLSFIHPVKKEPVRITARYPNTEWWNLFN